MVTTNSFCLYFNKRIRNPRENYRYLCDENVANKARYIFIFSDSNKNIIDETPDINGRYVEIIYLENNSFFTQ